MKLIFCHFEMIQKDINESTNLYQISFFFFLFLFRTARSGCCGNSIFMARQFGCNEMEVVEKCDSDRVRPNRTG